MARKRKYLPSPDRSVTEAVAWYRWAHDYESKQIEKEREGLRFQLADGAWPDDVKEARSAFNTPPVAGSPGFPVPARPMISIATLDEPFALASSQERQAHIAPSIHAISEDASDATAQILEELYRAIERDSNAGLARSWAYQRAWWAGRGVYRVDCVYDEYGGDPFDQKIVIKRIFDQSTVTWDPFAYEPDRCDATRLMESVSMSWAQYKRRWPNSKVASFDAETLNALSSVEQESQQSGWITGTDDATRRVLVALDWRVEVTHRRLVLLDDDSSAYDDEIPEGRTAKNGNDARSRMDESRRVFFRMINGYEELEPEREWNGQYIPYVPVIWRELQPIEGERYCIGVPENAKGAVRLTNYSGSQAVQMAALEPLAPWQIDPRQIEGYESWWQQSNIRAFPYLPSHNEINGVRFDKPQRVQVDASRLGPSMQLLQMGFDFVNRATAIHDPALGKQTPAFRSGTAIQALQAQSSDSISGGVDNLANVSVWMEARIVLDLIPRIYDRPERIARVLDDQGLSRLVMFNAPYAPDPITKRPKVLEYEHDDDGQLQMPMHVQSNVNDPEHPAQYIDLDKGRYAVEVTVGKNPGDKRQEGVTEMGAILQADPQLMIPIGPEYFRYRGEPWADQVAAILEKMRDVQFPYLAKDTQGANPQTVAALHAQNQQLQELLNQAMQKIQGKVIETQGKLAITQQQEQHEDARAALDRETKIAVAVIQAQAKQAVQDIALFYEERSRLGAQAHEAALGGAQSAHDVRLAREAAAHEVGMQAVEHQQAMREGAQEHAQNMEAAAVQAQQPQAPDNNGGGDGQ